MCRFLLTALITLFVLASCSKEKGVKDEEKKPSIEELQELLVCGTELQWDWHWRNIRFGIDLNQNGTIEPNEIQVTNPPLTLFVFFKENTGRFLQTGNISMRDDRDTTIINMISHWVVKNENELKFTISYSDLPYFPPGPSTPREPVEFDCRIINLTTTKLEFTATSKHPGSLVYYYECNREKSF